MFPIVRVDSSTAIALEPLGTKGKFWYTDGDGRRMLFKAEERGTGEDWAEKIVCELATILGIPHVHYEMAHDTATDKPGVVCASFIGNGEALGHGNSLLFALDNNYPKNQGRYGVAAHTVAAITKVLHVLGPPHAKWMSSAPVEIKTAIDVFVGYLLLDAWVANQDRHHENWGAVWTKPRTFSLAPSYDHGASLARLLTDEDRAVRLDTRDRGRSIAHYVTRARSAIYADAVAAHPMGTVETFVAFAARAEAAAHMWRERLRAVDEKTINEVLTQVPPDRLSAISRAFTLQLLLENRQRILDADIKGGQ